MAPIITHSFLITIPMPETPTPTPEDLSIETGSPEKPVEKVASQAELIPLVAIPERIQLFATLIDELTGDIDDFDFDGSKTRSPEEQLIANVTAAIIENQNLSDEQRTQLDIDKQNLENDLKRVTGLRAQISTLQDNASGGIFKALKNQVLAVTDAQQALGENPEESLIAIIDKVLTWQDLQSRVDAGSILLKEYAEIDAQLQQIEEDPDNEGKEKNEYPQEYQTLMERQNSIKKDEAYTAAKKAKATMKKEGLTEPNQDEMENFDSIYPRLERLRMAASKLSNSFSSFEKSEKTGVQQSFFESLQKSPKVSQFMGVGALDMNMNFKEKELSVAKVQEELSLLDHVIIKQSSVFQQGLEEAGTSDEESQQKLKQMKQNLEATLSQIETRTRDLKSLAQAAGIALDENEAEVMSTEASAEMSTEYLISKQIDHVSRATRRQIERFVGIVEAGISGLSSEAEKLLKLFASHNSFVNLIRDKKALSKLFRHDRIQFAKAYSKRFLGPEEVKVARRKEILGYEESDDISDEINDRAVDVIQTTAAFLESNKRMGEKDPGVHVMYKRLAETSPDHPKINEIFVAKADQTTSSLDGIESLNQDLLSMWKYLQKKAILLQRDEENAIRDILSTQRRLIRASEKIEEEINEKEMELADFNSRQYDPTHPQYENRIMDMSVYDAMAAEKMKAIESLRNIFANDDTPHKLKREKLAYQVTLQAYADRLDNIRKAYGYIAEFSLNLLLVTKDGHIEYEKNEDEVERLTTTGKTDFKTFLSAQNSEEAESADHQDTANPEETGNDADVEEVYQVQFGFTEEQIKAFEAQDAVEEKAKEAAKKAEEQNISRKEMEEEEDENTENIEKEVAGEDDELDARIEKLLKPIERPRIARVALESFLELNSPGLALLFLETADFAKSAALPVFSAALLEAEDELTPDIEGGAALEENQDKENPQTDEHPVPEDDKQVSAEPSGQAAAQDENKKEPTPKA